MVLSIVRILSNHSPKRAFVGFPGGNVGFVGFYFGGEGRIALKHKQTSKSRGSGVHPLIEIQCRPKGAAHKEDAL
jgi:hypothetical protein